MSHGTGRKRDRSRLTGWAVSLGLLSPFLVVEVRDRLIPSLVKKESPCRSDISAVSRLNQAGRGKPSDGHRTVDLRHHSPHGRGSPIARKVTATACSSGCSASVRAGLEDRPVQFHAEPERGEAVGRCVHGVAVGRVKPSLRTALTRSADNVVLLVLRLPDPLPAWLMRCHVGGEIVPSARSGTGHRGARESVWRLPTIADEKHPPYV